MLIEIDEKYLAHLKQSLEELKRAQELARDKEVIPDVSNQIGMQNLMAGGIVWLQQLVDKASRG